MLPEVELGEHGGKGIGKREVEVIRNGIDVAKAGSTDRSGRHMEINECWLMGQQGNLSSSSLRSGRHDALNRLCS